MLVTVPPGGGWRPKTLARHLSGTVRMLLRCAASGHTHAVPFAAEGRRAPQPANIRPHSTSSLSGGSQPQMPVPGESAISRASAGGSFCGRGSAEARVLGLKRVDRSSLREVPFPAVYEGRGMSLASLGVLREGQGGRGKHFPSPLSPQGTAMRRFRTHR